MENGKGLRDYGNYKISIVNSDTDEGILDFGTDVAFLVINYEPCSIPKVTMELSAMKGLPDTFFDIKNMGITVECKGAEYSFLVGIDKFTKKVQGNVEIIGYLCKYEDFNDVSSAYLGGSLEEALQALAIRDNITGADKITQDFWMIQETKIQAFLRILKYAAQNSLFTLTDDSILFTNLETSSEAKDELITDRLDYFYRNRKMKDLIESPTNILSYDSELSGLSMHTAFGATFIDATDYATSLLNRATSFPYEILSTDLLIKMRYDNIVFPYNIGDTMSITNIKNYTGNSLRVLNKTYTFTIGKPVQSTVLFCGVSPAEDE